jgi:hypothetical protein
MKTPLRVHICVVGYELDRISQAAIDQKADKVVLITQKENDSGRDYFIENRRRIIDKGIEVQEEFVDDIRDLPHLLRIIKKVIDNEHKENSIFINISSGSTLSAIAGTISSMMFEKERKIIPYYVKPKTYKQDIDEETGLKPQTEGIEVIKKILTFQMQLPSKELMIVLKYLKEEEEKGHTVTKKDLIEFSKEEEHLKLIRETKRHLANKIKVEKQAADDKNKEDKEKAKDYAWINQNIIRKLKEEWNLIEIYKIGTNACVKLNEKGKTMLDYLGY